MSCSSLKPFNHHLGQFEAKNGEFLHVFNTLSPEEKMSSKENGGFSISNTPLNFNLKIRKKALDCSYVQSTPNYFEGYSKNVYKKRRSQESDGGYSSYLVPQINLTSSSIDTSSESSQKFSFDSGYLNSPSILTSHHDKLYDIIDYKNSLEPVCLADKAVKLDFIQELLPPKRNLMRIVNKIFNYLEPLDLKNVRQVSSTWKTAIDSFLSENSLCKKNFQNLSHNKENCNSFEKSSLCKTPKSSKENPKLSKFEQFIKEGSSLGPGHTFKACPNCSSPSRVSLHINIATCVSCGLKFCPICRLTVHSCCHSCSRTEDSSYESPVKENYVLNRKRLKRVMFRIH